MRHRERVASLERIVAQCAEELGGLRRQAQHHRVNVAATRRLEAEQSVFERILAHARDWLSELENLRDGDAQRRAVLEAVAPDIRSPFGVPEKVRWRQRTWLADGVWAEIVKLLGEEREGVPVLSHVAGPELAIRTSLEGGAPQSAQDSPAVVNPVKISWPYDVHGGPEPRGPGRLPSSGFGGWDVPAPGPVP